MSQLYGIPNCDKVRSARKWLDKHHIEYSFCNLREGVLNKQLLLDWCTKVNWEELINRRSTTWRMLAQADKNPLHQDKAITLLLKHPTLLKRPVLAHDTRLIVGFDTAGYQQILAS